MPDAPVVLHCWSQHEACERDTVNTMSTESKIWTFDQLLRQRAVDEDQTPIIAFPRSRHGTTDYDRISGFVLDQFVDGAARQLARRGFPPVVSIEPRASRINTSDIE